MKTLNESLIDEFDEILNEFDFTNDDGKNIDQAKLKRIYRELLKHKDESDDFEKAARTVVNTVLSKEFES